MMIRKILIVQDEEGASLQQQLSKYEVTAVETLAAACARLSKSEFDLVLADVKLPDGSASDLLKAVSGMHHTGAQHPTGRQPLLLVISGFGSVESAVDSLRGGAFGYLLKPFSAEQLQVMLEKAEQHLRLIRLNQYFSRRNPSAGWTLPAGEHPLPSTPIELMGKSPAIERLHATVRKVARTDATVLIRGESGAGKTAIAQMLFLESSRSGAPFVRVDCGSLADDSIETQLLGDFDLANGGTLFLEEVGLLPLAAQGRLSQFLQRREVQPAEGNPSMPVDVRLIVTSNRDLDDMVQQGQFREDLLLALNIIPIVTPPLRERLEDIPILAEQFRNLFSRKYGANALAISPGCLSALQNYATAKGSWPGNVTELRNVIERAVLLCQNGVLEPEHLEGIALSGQGAGAGGVEQTDLLIDAEKTHILAVLERCNANRTHAAKRLGISLRTLRNKLREYRLEAAADSDTAEESEG